MKLKASTLVEAIVAMVIIMLIYFMAMSLFTNILTTGNTSIKLKAFLQMDALSGKMKTAKSYDNVEVTIDNIRITTTLTSYPGSDHLRIVNYEAFGPRNKLITSKKEIVKIENE